MVRWPRTRATWRHAERRVHADHVQDELGALSACHVLDPGDRLVTGQQRLIRAHALAVASLSAAVSTATTVVDELSARRIWMAIWPSPPAPITPRSSPAPADAGTA